jgi:hypothetical protein
MVRHTKRRRVVESRGRARGYRSEFSIVMPPHRAGGTASCVAPIEIQQLLLLRVFFGAYTWFVKGFKLLGPPTMVPGRRHRAPRRLKQAVRFPLW